MSSFVKSFVAIAFSASIVTPKTVAQMRATAIDSGITLPTSSGGRQATVEEELRQMSGQAAVIFAGQVLAVRPQFDLAWGAGSGWVEIEFRIDQAVRGCLGEATYTLREWSGLWAGGTQRYTVGQRLLMLLHPPNAAGLSSPVGGQDGAIPITGAGPAPRAQDRFLTAAEQAVDLRWIEARLMRPEAVIQGTHSTSTAGTVYVGRERAPLVTRKTTRQDAISGPRFNDGSSGRPRVLRTGIESTATVPLAGNAGQGVTLRSILALLGAWEAEQADAAH